MKIRKSKVIISGLLSIFGVSLIGVTAAQWAVSDNADSFTVRVSVGAFKPDEGYYLTFESDDYLTYGSRAVKMGSDAENFAKANNVTIHDGDQVRFYYYDGDTAEDVSSFITCSLGDPHGYASITSNTVTFDTDRHGDTYSFYLKDDSGNKLYMVDEDYSSYDGYYVTKSTDNGSTWCDFDLAWAMTGTSGDNVAEITHAFEVNNSSIKYRVEHFKGDRGIISSPKLQGGTYPHFTTSVADDNALAFANAGTYKLMLSAGTDKIYIQKPDASSLSGYYILYSSSGYDFASGYKMSAGSGTNHAEASLDIPANTTIKIAYYDGLNDGYGAYGTLGAAAGYINESVGSETITFKTADKYDIYLNKDDEIYTAIGSYNTVYLNPNSSYWGQSRATTSILLYFTMPSSDWSTVYAYAWDEVGSNGDNHSWPGVAATYVKDNDFGQKIYCYEVDTTQYNAIIFNNNNSGKQTADIYLTTAAGADANVKDCTQFYCTTGTSGAVTSLKYADERATTPYFYAWVWESTKADGRWVEMTASTAHTGYGYEMTIHSYESNVALARCAYIPTTYADLTDNYVVWNSMDNLTVPGDGYGYALSGWSTGSWSGAPLA